MNTFCTHRIQRVAQSIVLRLVSVELPCLQIRVGRFDSGPSLQSEKSPALKLGFFLANPGRHF